MIENNEINQFIFFDTETTGLNENDEIIELAITEKNGQPLFHSYFNPAAVINPAAQMVHKISKEAVKDSPNFAEKIKEIKQIFKKNMVAVAYNVEFDVRMIKQTCDRYNLDTKWMDEVTWACLMNHYSSYKFDPVDPKSSFVRHKLTNACKENNIQIQNAHSALGDCRMMSQLYEKMHKEDFGFVKNKN